MIRTRLVYALLVVALLALVAAPTNATPGLQPAPGQARVENNLSLGADGRCAGDVSISYSPKTTTPVARILARTGTNCRVDVIKEQLSPQIIAPITGDANVTATYESLGVGYLWLDGRFSRALNGCPQTLSEDHGQTPPYVPSSIFAWGSTATSSQSCFGTWQQNWTVPGSTGGGAFLRAKWIYVNGGGLTQSYYYSSCSGNPTTMNPEAITCAQYPAGLPLPSEPGSPYAWANPVVLGAANPGETLVMDMDSP